VKRIATLADARGVMWAPHISTGTALYIAASMHLAASTPNLLISEGGRALLGPSETTCWKNLSTGSPDGSAYPKGPV